jgi:hypothetical protein
MIVFRGRDRSAPMPFGPYLAAAGWLAMLYGDSLITATCACRASSISACAAPAHRPDRRHRERQEHGRAALSRIGVPVIDADEAARDVVAPGRPGLAAGRRALRRRVLALGGELDRRALRELIFADADAPPRSRGDPAPADQGRNGTRLPTRHPGPTSSWRFRCWSRAAARDLDRILVVDVDEPTAAARIMSRDGVSEAAGPRDLAAQASRAERLARRRCARKLGLDRELARSAWTAARALSGIAAAAPEDSPPGRHSRELGAAAGLPWPSLCLRIGHEFIPDPRTRPCPNWRRSIYEQPLNERMRTFLRLEFLYTQATYHSEMPNAWSARAAVASLLEILAITARGDSRSDVLKELERHVNVLKEYQSKTGVDPAG